MRQAQERHDERRRRGITSGETMLVSHYALFPPPFSVLINSFDHFPKRNPPENEIMNINSIIVRRR